MTGLRLKMHQDAGHLGTELHGTDGRTFAFISQNPLDRIMQFGDVHFAESQKKILVLGMMVHTCHPSLWEPEARRSSSSRASS